MQRATRKRSLPMTAPSWSGQDRDMADLSKLVDDLSSLTVLEAAELAKLLDDKWQGSKASQPTVSVADIQNGWRRVTMVGAS
jgi:hypothetical protein